MASGREEPGVRVVHLPVDDIDWGEQPRKDVDSVALAALTESVRAQGVLQPITVVAQSGGRYAGVVGNRRLLASRAAGLATVPAIVLDAMRSTAAETIARQPCENVARADLNPMELSDGLSTLIAEGGVTAAQAGARVGLSAPDVSRALALKRLTPSIQAAVRSGRISASAGYALSQVDPAEQAALAAEVTAGRLTRDQLAGRTRRKWSPAENPGPAGDGHRVAMPLADGRTVVLSGPGLDLDGVIRCLEDLLARARKARPQGIEVRTFAKMLRDQAKQPAAG